MKVECAFPSCHRPSRKLKLCNTHYSQQARGQELTPIRVIPPVQERFWSKVNKTETCWIWTAAKSKKGYGHFGIGPILVKSHRWSYEDAHGPIPDGMQIDHICRVKSCVNPDHLRVVTNKENQENCTAYATSKTGMRGVFWGAREGRWQVQVSHHGKRYHGGSFTDLGEANLAAIALRNRLFTHNEADRSEVG